MTTVTVRSGDTLSAIARANNTTVDALVKANNIQNPNLIFAGQTITIVDRFDSGAPVQTNSADPMPAPAGSSKALEIAQRYLGRTANELKLANHDPVGLAMQDWVPGNVNCANFVSGVLIAAGQLPSNKGNASVYGLVNNLKADPNWKEVPLSEAKPGDVIAFKTKTQHVEIVAGRNPDGTLKMIGSNNILKDGNQAVSYDTYKGNEIISVMRYVGPDNAGPGGPINTTPTPTLKKGASGASVSEMQQLLKNAGFDPGAIDGKFGPNTEKALKAFQKAMGLVVDGICGPKSWAALKAGSTPSSSPVGSAAPASASPAAVAPSSTKPVLKKGSSGASVSEMQQLLKNLGFDPGAVDGQFGPGTEKALKAFQSAKGLAVDGICGPNTWAALNNAAAASNPVLKKGSSGAAVTQMQQLLKTAGFDPGAADGQFGPNTDAALKKFQSAPGLDADGSCGPKTWAALSKYGSIAIPGGGGGGSVGGTKQVTQIVKGKKTTINLASIGGGKYLRTDAAAAFNRMAAAAKAAGITLQVNSAFRTNAEQQKLFNQLGYPKAAYPGTSNHEGGLSVDIQTSTKVLNWLNANAAKYGFRNDVSFEPWHWTYQG